MSMVNYNYHICQNRVQHIREESVVLNLLLDIIGIEKITFFNSRSRKSSVDVWSIIQMHGLNFAPRVLNVDITSLFN